MDKNLIQRLISGIIYGLVIFLCTTPMGEIYLYNYLNISVKQEYLYLSLIAFLTVVGAWECIQIMKFNTNWQWLIFPIGLLVFYKFGIKLINHHFLFQPNLQEILGLSLIFLASLTLFKFPNELYFDNGKFIFTIIYVFLSFSFALGIPSLSTPSLNNSHNFGLEAFILFVLIWSSDSFAYFFGRLFGKHKMAPKISPKKTWEGFIGGVICTLILGFFIEQYLPEMRGNWLIIGFLVSIFAPLGDLVESQLKRTFGVKDSGNIIPGHGGVLDRLDSFIICAPVIYIYFILDKLF